MNLCTNAAHAMRDRKGCLEFILEPFTVDADMARAHPGLRPGRYARLVIADTGHGMNAQTLGRIFDPFFTTKRPGEGTGLGLAVVHGIMQSHDGAVIVHSEPGVGSRFELYFPAHDAAAAEPAPVDRGEHRPAARGERILVVDDETAIVNVLCQALRVLRYDVRAATDAEEAWRMFAAAPEGFDLVICDLTMPGLTGPELAARMRARRPGLPVILSSGFSSGPPLERARAMGITDFLPKPITMEQLGETVWDVLERHRRVAGVRA
jgi:CheY-like chemotaxis protein